MVFCFWRFSGSAWAVVFGSVCGGSVLVVILVWSCFGRHGGVWTCLVFSFPRRTFLDTSAPLVERGGDAHGGGVGGDLETRHLLGFNAL